MGEVARPIRIDVWYPAECEGADRMPLSDYMAMESPGPLYDDLVFLTHRWDEYSYRGLPEDSAAFDRLMATATAACPGAPPASGRFPLVVYSAGWFNRAPDNTVLLEYLASRGFVAATVPQLNPGLWTFSFASDAPGVENQVRDLELAIGVLAGDPRVDRSRVAAMGYSTGGDVALLLAGRNPLVDAVVGLDASWTLGRENDVASSSLFIPSRHEEAVIALRRPFRVDSLEADVLHRMIHAPRLLAAVPGGDHGSFSDDPPQRLLLGSGSTAAADRHARVVRATAMALESALSGPADLEALATELRGLGLEPATVLVAEPPESDG